MREKNMDYVIMEVSSHALDQNRVAGIEFDTAIFTNLTQDHLDFHITMQNYFKAKSKLFENLYSDDFAVINADDSYASQFLDVISPNVKIFTYGIKSEADVKATNILFDNNGASFVCKMNGKSYDVNLKMNGMFSVYNVFTAFYPYSGYVCLDQLF